MAVERVRAVTLAVGMNRSDGGDLRENERRERQGSEQRLHSIPPPLPHRLPFVRCNPLPPARLCGKPQAVELAGMMSASKLWLRRCRRSAQTTRKVSDTTGKLPATGVSLIRPVVVAVAGFHAEKRPSLGVDALTTVQPVPSSNSIFTLSNLALL